MIDIGNSQIIGKRDNQEDYFASIEIGEGMLSIVADGMGGYEGGEVASQVSTKSFIEFFKNNFNTISVGELLVKATHYANSKLEKEKENNSSLEEMGCTLVAVYLTEKTLFWVSVGDSILYRYANMQLVRLNADHSVAGDYQKQVDAGEITQEEADSKPNRHALTSALTGYEIPHIEQSQIQVNNDDRFIIASDGIHTLDENQIEHLASKQESNQGLSDSIVKLIEKKNLNNQDNTTIVILQSKGIHSLKKDTNVKSNKTVFLLGIIIALTGIIGFLVNANYSEVSNEKLFTSDTNACNILLEKDSNITDINQSNNTEKSIGENNETSQ